MRNLFIPIFLLFLSLSATAGLNITIVVQEAVSENVSHPVPGAMVKSGIGNEYTNADGEARFYNISEDHLYEKMEIIHPEYSFPNFKLIDFPYVLESGILKFTITGAMAPKPIVQVLNVAASSSKKKANAHAVMRCIAPNYLDSLTLLNIDNEYICSFEKNGMFTPQSASEISLSAVENGGKIVNITRGDTTEFGADHWKFIIPLQPLKPIMRAESEITSVLHLLQAIDDLNQKHYSEKWKLKLEIEHLEDSITQILNPELGPAIIDELPEPRPEEFLIDFPIFEAQPPIEHGAFVQNLSDLIVAENPKRCADLVFEITILTNGRVLVKNLVNIDDYQELTQSIKHYLTATKWRPYEMGGRVHKSTQILQLNILPE